MSNRSIRDARRPVKGQPEQWQSLPDVIKYGDVCYQSERFTDALESYDKALREHPHLTPVLKARLHYRLACCHTKRASFAKALEHLDEARSCLPRHLDKSRLAKIYGQRGRIMQEMGQYRRARRYLSWSKKLLQGSDEHEELALIEQRLGAVFARLGLNDEARNSFLNALTTYRRIEHRSGEAGALNNLALLHKNMCEYREAVRYLHMAREICESIGFREDLVRAYLSLGIIHFKLGKWELCQENLAVAERLATEVGSKAILACIYLALGNLRLRQQRWQESESYYQKAADTSQKEGYRREQILAQEFLGELYLAMGEPVRALSLLTPALEDAQNLAPQGDLVYEIDRRMGEAYLVAGQIEDAHVASTRAVEAAMRLGDKYEAAIAKRGLGLAEIHLGRKEQGFDLLEQSLSSLDEIGDAFQKGLTHLEYGRVLMGDGAATVDMERAGAHLQRAYGSFLDLDARRLAAWSAYERSQFELRMGRYDESAVYREKAMSLHTAGEDLTLDGALERLGADLYASFAEGWSKSSEIARSLDEIRRLFQGADTTHSATEELVRLAVMQTNSDRGCVAETTDTGFSILAVHGWDQEYAAGHLQKIDGVLESVAKENNPLWSTIQGSPHLPADREGENENFVVLPLTLNDQRSGFLYVEKVRGARGGSYHTGDMHLLTVLASLTAISVIGQKNTQLEKENEALRRQIEASTRFVTANPELLESIRLAKKVAQSPVSILISGETGTGKGLLSHVIHESSNRSDKPFVQINCAALPEQLLESELFGHMKGAFTGATYNKVGLFKEADGGTLFLDEVDKASLSVQSKLLHVLDTKEVRPVGSVQSFVVDTRVICATNSELRQQIEDGHFLRDLYYRLNDFTVPVHALRERPEDLPLLIDHFLTKFCDQYDRDMVKLSPQVREALLNHKWPGNVRELEKTLRRLVVLSDAGTLVGAELLPAEMQVDAAPIHGNGAPTTLRAELARTERRVLLDALQERDWNRSKVSRDLKISYPSLLKKIKEYNLEPAARS